MTNRTTSRRVRLLRTLEARLTTLDEGLRLVLARRHAAEPPNRRSTARSRLAFRPVRGPAPARVPGGPRLKFAPLPPQVDRVVIQNWNPHPGFVPIGDVELELDPGAAVTLWVNRAAPTPDVRTREPEDRGASLYILCDDRRLAI